jgi:hypothetical protein
MNDTNLLPTLARLSINAAYVISALIIYLKQQRGLTGLPPATFEQKNEKEWAEELSTLTPEEVITIATLIDLFKRPETTLTTDSTYVTTSVLASLQEQQGSLDITAPTTDLKTGEEWAEELSTLTPENILKAASVISMVKEPSAFSKENLKTDPTTKTSPFIKRLTAILLPKPPTLAELQKESKTRQEQLNKTIEEHFKERAAELAEIEKPPPTKKPPAKPKPKEVEKPTVKPTLIIERIPYPKWWKDSLVAKIDLTAPGTQILATVSGKLRLFVATIVITVNGETEISFKFGGSGTSGPIYLGGEGQPMGFVAAMGNSPAPCGHGSFSIMATDPNDENPSIGGFATCFVEEL